MSAPRRFTNEELAVCAEREVKQRERAYPRWVENRRMTQKLADAQLALMREIAAVLREMASKDPGPTDLFGGGR